MTTTQRNAIRIRIPAPPELTDEMLDEIITHCQMQAHNRAIRERERLAGNTRRREANRAEMVRRREQSKADRRKHRAKRP